MTILADGTVIGSHMGVSDTSRGGGSTEQFGQWGLRMGIVRDIIYPEDKRSESKRFIEYTVEVQFKDSQGRTGTTPYSNVFLASAFGGRGDKIRYTHRAAKQVDDQGLGLGSKVVIGHLNGDRQQAIILGGIRDQNDKPDKEDDGHNYLWEFNGVQTVIRDDGSYELLFKGATDYDGEARSGVDRAKGGTKFVMDAKGDLYLAHDDQTLRLNHAAQAWEMEAVSLVSLKAKRGQVKVDGYQGVEITATDKFANGGLGAEVRVAASSNIVLECRSGVRIGSELGHDNLVMGTTYRNAQSALHRSMIEVLTQLTVDLASAGAALLVPVIGPPASSLFVTKAATDVVRLVAAIGQFESQSVSFLSRKNTTD